jgi:UPF0755 protein
MKSIVLLVLGVGVLAVIAGGLTWYLDRPHYEPLAPRPELTIRIREGETMAQLAARLVQQGVASSSEEILDYWQMRSVADLATSTRDRLQLVKPAGIPLEGYLFADTYRVFSDGALAGLTSKALTETVENLEAEVRKVATIPQSLTPHEVLTLASIIEREVPSDVDRAKVADVFLKRLAAGIPLQSDVTVNYATGRTTTKVTAADLAIRSPYNTYQNRGLPPGPISFPSLSSIRAVLHPAANPYYYFLATPEGEVIYSKTNDEHAKAKKKYLR